MPDEPRDPSYIVKDIADGASTYLRALEEFSPQVREFGERFNKEADLAREAHRLFGLFCELDLRLKGQPYPFGIECNRTLKRLRQALCSQLERWGWGFLERPDGMTCIADRLAAHREQKEVPYLRANMAWRLQDDVKNDPRADPLYDFARALGLEPDPAVTPENAERLARERFDRWAKDSLCRPELGESPPDYNDQEVIKIANDTNTIVRFAERVVTPDEFLRGRDSDDINRQIEQNRKRIAAVMGQVQPREPSVAPASSESVNPAHGTPKGGPEKVEEQGSPADEPDNAPPPVSDLISEWGSLAQIHCDILDAAWALGATDKASRIPQDRIAKRADIAHGVGSTSFAFGELVRRGFLMTKPGRGGGTWLTEKGLKDAKAPNENKR
jgi:hypothetical protein